MFITNLIACGAFIVSIIGIHLTYKHNQTTIEWNFYKLNLQKGEQAKQEYYTKNISRINVIPHFHLLLDKKIEVKTKSNNEEILILPISLINVGRENATNIMLVPVSENEPSIYFKTDRHGESHQIREYIDKQYGMIGDKINFTIACNKHDKHLYVHFKISFNDIIGRSYQQRFCFLYDPNSDLIAMNHTSYLPVCIDDQDKTIEAFKEETEFH